MKYQYKRTALLAFLASSPAIFAAPPVAYDGWSVANGVIDTSASCNGNVSCTELVSDPGMKYEEVTADGTRFLRLILTDEGANGTPNQQAFAAETYVPYARIGEALPPGYFNQYQGMAGKQVTRDAVDNFEGISEIQRANMRQLNSASADDMYSVKLSQTLGDAEASTSFAHTNYTQFNSGGTSIDSSQVIGSKTDITQTTDVGGTSNPGIKQVFVKRTRGGAKGNSTYTFPGNYFVTGNITTPGSMNVSATAEMPNPAVTWIERNEIETTWVVQGNNSSSEAGVGINYQSVKNNTSGVDDIFFGVELSASTADPFAWDPNFDIAPTLP